MCLNVAVTSGQWKVLNQVGGKSFKNAFNKSRGLASVRKWRMRPEHSRNIPRAAEPVLLFDGDFWSSDISCDRRNPRESISLTLLVSSKLDDSTASWPWVLSSFLVFFLPHPLVRKSRGKR